MRKILTAAMALALALSLAACGGQGGTADEGYDTALVATVAEGGAFSEELEELDGDTAFALYKLADHGLAREDLTDCAVMRSAGATCEEAAVLVLTDKDKAAEAKTAMSAYVEGQIEANVDYRPAEIPKLESALVEQKGNTVLLVVANDLETAKTALGDQ